MNRRQRRAKGPEPSTIQTAEDIPLAHPAESTSKAKGKTLYEIAAERQAQRGGTGQPFSLVPGAGDRVKYVKITPDGLTSETADEAEDIATQADEISPFFDTLLFTTSLSALHFTLEVLTVHQYAEQLRFPPIIKHTLFIAFPTLFLAIHLAHGHLLSLPAAALSDTLRAAFKICQQISFVVIANVAGCYLIQLTNDQGYYAVMKNAPSIGTIWVWSVIELGLLGALAGVAGPGLYAWYYGYSVY